jgi:very-short-patch-repair endonuclease
MSLSHLERKMPQRCVFHKRYFPKEPTRIFSFNEGRFVKNNSLFVCYRCLQKERSVKGRTNSTVETTVAQELTRKNIDYRQQFKLGEFIYDFAFPRFKILLDTDSKTYHDHPPAGHDTPGSRENTPIAHGWRLVHVENGSRLAERAVKVVCDAVSS